MRRATLTKARQKHGRAMYKGGVLNYPAGVQSRYAAELGALTGQLIAQVERDIIKLWRNHSFGAEDASPASQARITVSALTKKFTDLFSRRAASVVDGIMKQIDKATTSALHSSLKEASGGLSLKTSAMDPRTREIFKAAALESTSLIKSIPEEYLGKVSKFVFRSITDPNVGLDKLQENLERIGGMTKRRAQLIALDQTRKTFSSVNAAKAQALGVKRFEWIHSGGGSHPRTQHQDWDGQIFSYDNLPVDDDFGPVLPGIAINCRCKARIVLFAEGEEDE